MRGKQIVALDNTQKEEWRQRKYSRGISLENFVKKQEGWELNHRRNTKELIRWETKQKKNKEKKRKEKEKEKENKRQNKQKKSHNKWYDDDLNEMEAETLWQFVNKKNGKENETVNRDLDNEDLEEEEPDELWKFKRYGTKTERIKWLKRNNKEQNTER